MRPNIRIRIQESDGVCTLSDLSGGLLRRIQVKDNLDEGLSLLRRVNRIKNADGRAIYDLRIVHGASAWSFHQSRLFWENLRHFVFYQDVIKFLIDNNYIVVISGGERSEMLQALKYSGVEIEEYLTLRIQKIPKNIKIFISNMVLAGIAKAVGYPCLLSAMLRKADTLVYSPDKYHPKTRSDFRMAEMYKFFTNNSIPVTEVFHTLLGKVFVKNLISRRRLGLYLEFLPLAVSSSPINRPPCDPIVTEFSRHQRNYIRSLVVRMDNLAKQSVLRALTLRRIARLIGPNRLVTIDDMRSAQEVVTACRSLGIKSYAFQHGHINKYHTGHMNYEIPARLSSPFDLLFTWNKYWKDKLIAHSTLFNARNVQVGGYLRPPKEMQIKPKPLPKTAEETAILVANDTWAPREEVRYYLKRFVEMGCQLYLSVRPDLPVEKQLADFGLGPHPNVHISYGAEAALEGKVHCVAGVYSTFIYEMMYYDIPAIVFQTSFSFGDDLVKDNLAYKIDRDFEFPDILQYLSKAESKKDLIWEKQEVTVESTLRSIFDNSLNPSYQSKD